MTDPCIITMLRSPARLETHTCNEAADEIERLREELTASHESHGNEVGALTERLSLAIHERDEARRAVCCNALPSDYKKWNPKDVDAALKLIAAQQGWDCFKEDGK